MITDGNVHKVYTYTYINVSIVFIHIWYLFIQDKIYSVINFFHAYKPTKMEKGQDKFKKGEKTIQEILQFLG